MKRLIAAGILAVLLICGCIFGHFYVSSACDKTKTEIIVCKTAVSNGDYKKAKKQTEKLCENWEKRRNKLIVFVNRGLLDEISETLSGLACLANEDTKNEFEASSNQISFLLNLISNGQRFTANAFF